MDVIDDRPTQRDLLVLIKEKQDRMSDDVLDIKRTIKEMDECQQQFRLSYTSEHVAVVNAANNAHKRIDDIIL